jgi:hypothetical protein
MQREADIRDRRQDLMQGILGTPGGQEPYQMGQDEMFPGEEQIPGLLNETAATGMYQQDPTTAGLLQLQMETDPEGAFERLYPAPLQGKDRYMSVDGKVFDTQSQSFISGGAGGGGIWDPEKIQKEYDLAKYTPESVQQALQTSNPAVLRPSTAPGSYGEVAGLRKDVAKIEEPYRTASTAAKQLDALLGQGGGVGDLAATISFVKSLDPTSVVREGEVAMQQQASGLINRIGTLWDQATKAGGGGLTKNMRQQIQDSTRRLMEILESEYAAQVGPYYDEYSDYLKSGRLQFPKMTTPVFSGQAPAPGTPVASPAVDAGMQRYGGQ